MSYLRKQISLIIFLLTVVVLSSYVSLGKNIRNDEFNEAKTSTTINQELVYEYNSTSTMEEYEIAFSHLELNYLNKISLIFVTSGYLSNNLKVTFIINDTSVEFKIINAFQDNSDHIIEKGFKCSNIYSGPMNITIICEGQLNYPLFSGTITIYSSTNLEPVSIPNMRDSLVSLPLVPNSLMFLGSEEENVMSAFFIDTADEKCNISLSFFSNDFVALDSFVEVEINNEILKIEEFYDNDLNSFIFLLPVISGLNFIVFHFTFAYCFDLVLIDNIQLTGYAYSLIQYIPENTVDYHHWEGNSLSHIFDLSSLKPSSIHSNQILRIRIDYGYLGSMVYPAIDYSISIGSENLIVGQININEQTNSSHSIEVVSNTTSYFSPLFMSISGSAEGEGIFYILNTSKVETENIPMSEEDFSNIDTPTIDIDFNGGSMSILWLLIIIPFLVVTTLVFRRLQRYGKMALMSFFTNSSKNDLVENRKTENEQIRMDKVTNNQKRIIKKISCYYCNAELTKPDDDGPIVCLNCGKKTRSCEICKKYMVAGEKLVQVISCGHVFHKDHILEWIKVKGICPICKERMNEESIINYYPNL